MKNNRFWALVEFIRKDYKILGSWPRVASKYGITPPTARRISLGHEPKKKEIRLALGLAARPYTCGYCKSEIHYPGQRVNHKLQSWKSLNDLTAAELTYLLNHRENMR